MVVEIPITPDEPYALKEPEEVERRRGMLTLPHIVPLVDYAGRIVARMGPGCEIPWFDP